MVMLKRTYKRNNECDITNLWLNDKCNVPILCHITNSSDQINIGNQIQWLNLGFCWFNLPSISCDLFSTWPVFPQRSNTQSSNHSPRCRFNDQPTWSDLCRLIPSKVRLSF